MFFYILTQDGIAPIVISYVKFKHLVIETGSRISVIAGEAVKEKAVSVRVMIVRATAALLTLPRHLSTAIVLRNIVVNP